MMNKKQTTTTLALVGMAILTTVMTTTINYVTPASALGHFKEPNGLSDFSGLPMNDKTSEFDGLLDKDHRSGYDTFLDGTSGALSGFPDEEIQGCLSEIEGNGSPTEQQVQECMESSYGKIDSENATMESTEGGDEDGENGENGEDGENGDSEE